MKNFFIRLKDFFAGWFWTSYDQRFSEAWIETFGEEPALEGGHFLSTCSFEEAAEHLGGDQSDEKVLAFMDAYRTD